MLIVGYKERKQKQKEEFKAEILASALALFSEEGYAGFSMRKLAARIDHSPTTIYLYFKDKDDLLFHICEDLYAALYNKMQEFRQMQLPPHELLRAVYCHYIQYSLSHPEQYKVVFFSNPHLYGPPEEYLARETMSNRCWKSICEVVDDCLQKGFFRPMESSTLSIVLWSAVHGLVSSLIFTKDFPMPPSEKMIEMLFEGLFNGYCT